MVRNRTSNPVFQVILVGFILLFLFFMLVGFGAIEPEAVVNLVGKERFLQGEEQSFHIFLRTVDPEQFRTETTFREQFGRWRIEDIEGNIVSTGTTRRLSLGIYDSLVTIDIPFDYDKTVLIAEILEFQYAAPEPGAQFLSDEGTIRTSETIELPVQTCSSPVDCEITSRCAGQFPVCQDKLCELLGECETCIRDTDCPSTEAEEFECINEECRTVTTLSFDRQIEESFSDPVSRPGKVTPGQPIAPKQAPALLQTGVMLNSGFIIYMLFRRRKK